jgi:integrase
MALLQLMRGMGSEYVPHGFRSTFRTWAAETTNYPHDVAEAALAHTIPEAVVRAYKRTDLFQKRVRLMRDWAAYFTRPAPASDVASLDEARRARL